MLAQGNLDVADRKAISRLDPRNLQVDVLSWRVNVQAVGDGVFSTPPTPGATRSLRREFDYLATELRIGMTIETTVANLTDFNAVRFNFQIVGADRNLFSTDVEVSPLITPVTGAPVPLRFNPGLFIPGGVDLRLATTTRDAALLVARILTVKLVCLLIPREARLAA